MNTQERLKTYIDAETKDSLLYRELAGFAPNDEYADLLIEFAEDEQSHADNFRYILERMTGRDYNPQFTPPVIEGDFFDILAGRVLDESGDYRKYGEQVKLSERNELLRNAYYKAHMDENVHALRLLYMLGKR